MNKRKLLIFHPALAPYRVDQFNALSELFDLEVVFLFDNVWNHKFDQAKLLSMLHCKYSFLSNGPTFKGRVFRFGMLKTIKRINPDIVFGYEFSFTTQYLILLKIFGFITQQLGSTIDDSIEMCEHIQTKIRYLARKHAVKHLDYLVVMSNEVSHFYQERFQLKQDHIIISPILQDPGRLRNNWWELEIIARSYIVKYQLQGKKVLLFVGRFVQEKALTDFIRIICPLLQQQKDLVLVLVGDGNEKREIELLIRENRLENKVLMPGRYEGRGLHAWYLCASGFVLPSLFEPFGAVVNEALIFGIQVLCSKFAGASCLITPNNGIIFNPLSGDETIEELSKFLNLIDVVGDSSLINKVSLMSDFKNDLIKEWGKLMSSDSINIEL